MGVLAGMALGWGVWIGEFWLGSLGFGVWDLVRWVGLRYLNHIHIMFGGIKNVALVIRNDRKNINKTTILSYQRH